MSVKKENSGFGHFFKEDDLFIREVIHAVPAEETPADEPSAIPAIPALPPFKPAEDHDLRAYWRELRKFFSTGHQQGAGPKGLYPLVLSPGLTRSLVGLEFPVWINTDPATYVDLPASRSLNDLISEAMARMDDRRFDMRILGQQAVNMPALASELMADGRPALFAELFERLTDTLNEKIQMGDSDRKSFREAMEQLRRLLPREGAVLPQSPAIPFQLLEAGMMSIQERERQFLLEDIQLLNNKLEDLIRIEEEKSSKGKDPEKLKASLGLAGNMLSADALSAFLPDTGSKIMDPDRLARINRLSKVLGEAPDILANRSFVVIEKDVPQPGNNPWGDIFEKASISLVETGKGVEAITKDLNDTMGRCATLFASIRSAELELEGRYQPELHDDYFTGYSWENMEDEELNCCPFFVLIADAQTLLGAEYQALNQLLHEQLPIRVLGMRSGLWNGSSAPNDAADLHSHDELTGLMLGHKNLFVGQNASIAPAALMEAYQFGLSSFSPAFYHILNPVGTEDLLYSSAVIEGRDFPGFMYAGLLGTPWGSRFSIRHNPQASLIWPEHELAIEVPEEGTLTLNFPFTFADQAALVPGYHRYFKVVDPAYWTDDLVPVSDYIENSSEQPIGAVPFIWMIDDQNIIHKVAVSWQIVVATEERRDHWRFLQESSGIGNFHVERAIAQLKKQLDEKHQIDLETLKAEHALELEKVRGEAAGQVMEDLTSVLLGLDLSSAAAAAPKPGKSPSVAPKSEPVIDELVTAEELEPAQPASAPVVLSNDPYIDTVMCTSCNECININSAMFRYNANKMAIIADPKAGTFEELVRAAENCPVSIIHPGSPLNPAEANLDELIERAKPYN